VPRSPTGGRRHAHTERTGPLAESTKAYDDASLLPLAKNLKRPSLPRSRHGGTTTCTTATLEVADPSFRAGNDFEFAPLACSRTFTRPTRGD